MAPTIVGAYQVNAQLPAGLVGGAAVPLQIVLGGRSSNIVTIAIR